MKFKVVHICLAASLISFSVKADDRIIIGGMDGPNPDNHAEKYSVLLALSGGGARGLTSIGILKAFEEKNIRVQAIAGTSIGGIIGGLYASGYSANELDSIAARLDFSNLFSNSPSRKSMFLTQRQGRDRHLLSIRLDGFRPIIPKALTAGQKLTSILNALTNKANYHSGADFSRLPIPFKSISTDIVSGNRVILDKGSIADAMRAAMAFPLAFTGLEKNGQILMDGGMLTPIPVELARSACDSVDFVVAINTASQLADKNELITPLDIANQVTSIMTADKLKAQLALADFVIEPPLDDFKSIDFKYKDSLVALGYQVGLTAADSIINLIKQRQQKIYYSIKQLEIQSPSYVKIDGIKNQLLNKTLSRKELIAQLKQLAKKFNFFRIECDITLLHTTIQDTVDVLLKLDVYQNFQYSEVNFQFSGNTIFDDTTLIHHLVNADSIITPSNLQKGLDRIIALYNDNGFDLVDIKKLQINPDNKTINIEIDEAIINKINIDNNIRTKDWFIKSYFPLKTGQPYSTTRASRGIANIYGTDLFDRVTVDVQPSDSGAMVKIGVEEKKYNQIRLGWHWDDEYRSEEFIEYLDDHVGGMGLEYLLHARYSMNRQNYYLSFKTNRILSTYLTSKLVFYHRRLDRQLYREDETEAGKRKEIKTGFDIMFGQQIARLGMVSARLIMEEVEYEHSLTKQKDKFGLRIVKLESLVENFDRIPFPTTGNKHLFQLQLVGKLFGGDVEFTKFFTTHEVYFPFGKYLNYHPRVALGISRSGLPASEKFYLGGSSSLVGFRTHQLSGDKMINISQEIRFKLPLMLYLTIRYDMGEVYNSFDQIKLRNLRHGVGASLAIDSPIGPFEFVYGVANNDINRFYLNIGLAF